MKSSLFSKIILAISALALASSAVAASDSHKGSFEIAAATQINGTTLPAGEYTAKWEGSGPTVQVNIMQGRKVIATVPAQVVALDSASSDTQAEVKNGSNGERELKALQFAGKKFSLQLGADAAQTASKQ